MLLIIMIPTIEYYLMLPLTTVGISIITTKSLFHIILYYIVIRYVFLLKIIFTFSAHKRSNGKISIGKTQ